MASLKDARALTEHLHALSGRLQSELEKGSADFERLVELSDEIGESADRLATTFNAINGSLTGLLTGEAEKADGGESGPDVETEQSATTPKRQRQSRAGRGRARAGRQARRTQPET